jgi:hypothetical protein
VKNFLVLGSHNTITPCALPAWLPNIVAKKVLQAFTLELNLVSNSIMLLYDKDSTSDHDGSYSSDADSNASNQSDDTQPLVQELQAEPGPGVLFHTDD